MIFILSAGSFRSPVQNAVRPIEQTYQSYLLNDLNGWEI
jgi:hypothetical protein